MNGLCVFVFCGNHFGDSQHGHKTISKLVLVFGNDQELPIGSVLLCNLRLV